LGSEGKGGDVIRAHASSAHGGWGFLGKGDGRDKGFLGKWDEGRRKSILSLFKNSGFEKTPIKEVVR